jgi:hypothetical protein
MPKDLEVIELKRSKGSPSVEIIFGQAHLGNYRVFLWDAEGKNPEQLSHGNNLDDVPDAFTVAFQPKDLDKRILSYELIIQAAEARPGQVYSATIIVRQDGMPCKGGVIPVTGPMEDVKSIIGFRRFMIPR